MKKKLCFNLSAMVAFLCLAVPSFTFAQVNLEEGLVIYYPFTGDAVDASGNGYDGIIMGATLTEDRFNEADKAFYFNRNEQDHILVGMEIPDLTHLSISVWIYLMDPDGNATIFCDATIDLGNDCLMNVTDESIGIRADKGDAVLDYEDGAVFDLNLLNAWHHVVWLMSSETSIIYLDGNVVFTVNEYGANVSYHAPAASVGRRHVWDEGDQYYDGKIDEFRLYNRLLSEAEIQALYSGSSGLTEDGKEHILLTTSPNPVLSRATFTYTVDQSGQTTLAILDLSGRTLVTLVDEWQNAGTYTTEYSPVNLPPGLYCCMLKTRNKSLCGKLLVSRQ